MQVCTSLQTDSHASTSLLIFFQAGCPSCHPTNSVKALKAHLDAITTLIRWFCTCVHLCVHSYTASALTKPPGFCFCWAGARATYGVCAGKVKLSSLCHVADVWLAFCDQLSVFLSRSSSLLSSSLVARNLRHLCHICTYTTMFNKFLSLLRPPPIGEQSIVMSASLSLSLCLSVCDHIFGTTHPFFTDFFVRVTYSSGSVLL